MDAVLQSAISNALAATVLAGVVLAVGPLIRRPQVLHLLWVLVLVKLLAPPFGLYSVALPGIPRFSRHVRSDTNPSSSIPAARAPSNSTRHPDTSLQQKVTAGSDDDATRRRPYESLTTLALLRLVVEHVVHPDQSRFDPKPFPAHKFIESLVGREHQEEPTQAANGAKPIAPTLGSTRAGRSIQANLATTWHEPLQNWLVQALLVVWLGGSICVFARCLSRMRAFAHFIRSADLAPVEVQQRTRRLAKRIGLRRAPAVWMVDGPISPMVFAMVFSRRATPKLLFPLGLWRRLSPDELETLLLHELAHLRRRDNWVRLLELAASLLFWWHPIFWLARRGIHQAEEESCDALVTQHAQASGRTYAMALMAVIDFLADPRPHAPPGACGLGDHIRFLRRRITAIMRQSVSPSFAPSYRRPSRNSRQVLHTSIAAAVLFLTPQFVAQEAAVTSARQTASRVVTPLGASVRGLPISGGRPAHSIVVDPSDIVPERISLTERTHHGESSHHDDATQRPPLPAALVMAIDCSPDVGLIASCNENGVLHLVDGATNKVLATWHGEDVFSDVAFSPDGAHLAVAGFDHSVTLWRNKSWRNDSWRKESPRPQRLFGHSSWVFSVAFSPNGKLLASASADRTIRLWEVETGRLHKTLEGHNAEVRCVAFSASGRLLASGGDDETLRVWSLQTGQLLFHRPTGAAIRSIAVSSDGLLAAACDDRSIKVWKAFTGERLATLTGHTSAIGSVAFSPSPHLLASSDLGGRIILWDLPSAKPSLVLSAPQGGPLRGLAYAPIDSEDADVFSILYAGGEGDTIWRWPLRKRESSN